MGKRRNSRKSNSIAGSFVKRLIRSVFAILILSAFVLGIAFGVSKASSVDASKITRIVAPYLAKIGISESLVGQVAGEVIERATDIGLEEKNSNMISENNDKSTEDKNEEVTTDENVSSASTQKESVAKLAIIADSHVANDRPEYIENKEFLRKSLSRASEANVNKAIHVGDLTNLGVLADLREVKSILEGSELEFAVLPGDRDLYVSAAYDSTNSRANFNSTFSKANQTLQIEGLKFVLFDNSANYTLIDEKDLTWFKNEVSDADFVVLSQPIYSEGLSFPYSSVYMGSSFPQPEDENLQKKQADVLAQRDIILSAIRESDVKAVFAGDHHRSSKVEDSQKQGLVHYVVGSVGGTVSEYSQKSLQSQRFSILSLFEDGSYDVSEIEL